MSLILSITPEFCRSTLDLCCTPLKHHSRWFPSIHYRHTDFMTTETVGGASFTCCASAQTTSATQSPSKHSIHWKFLLMSYVQKLDDSGISPPFFRDRELERRQPSSSTSLVPRQAHQIVTPTSAKVTSLRPIQQNFARNNNNQIKHL
jgi:hypothetical protein